MGRVSKPAAVLAAAALLVGGGAYALASTGGGTITVCVHHRGGALYKAKRCHRGDKKLSWNKQGPTGQAGTAGTPGAPGSPAASIMTARTHANIGDQGYFTASGQSAGLDPTESDVTILTPDATTVAQNLAVRDERSSAGDNTRVYVLRVNGADTALTCSIVDAAHTCTDSTHTVTIPPDSEVSIHRAVLTGTGGGADGTDVLAAWRATTP